MRILTLNNNYPPHYYGGYELTCRDVMARFREAGHEVTVLTSDVRVPGVADDDDPEVVRRLRAYWDWEAGKRRIPASPPGRWRVERNNLRALRAALDRSRPDVVSVWHMMALSLSMLRAIEERRLPMVLTIGNDWLVQAPDYDGWARLWQRWPLPAPSSVFGVPVTPPALASARANFVSEFCKRQSLATGRWRFPEAPICHPGIDERDFPIAASPRQDWRWRLLYVGRIDPTKGIATLVTAFATLPAQARLELLGGGNARYRASIRELAAQFGISDRLTFDTCPRHRLRERYCAADVVIFPSEWEEPFGLVPLEAMACGVPVVATATGGAAEYLADGENCRTFRPADPQALATTVREVAADASSRARIIAGGLRTAAELTMTRYADSLLALHQAAAG
jgi:glycosyltransferase involved in cell wall biosynthesis